MVKKFVCLRCGKEYLLSELRYSKMDKCFYCSVKDCGYSEFKIIKGK